jgi:hypothetical protein
VNIKKIVAEAEITHNRKYKTRYLDAKWTCKHSKAVDLDISPVRRTENESIDETMLITSSTLVA